MNTVSTELAFSLSLLMGLLFGSFITLLSYRLVHGGPMLVARSRCPHCKHTLNVRDLFPVLSWVFSHAKCRYCAAPISMRYPLTEIITAFLFVLMYLQFGVTLQTLIMWGVCTVLMVIIVVDLEHQIIPDEMQIALAILGVFYVYAWDYAWQTALITAFGMGAGSYALRYVFWLWKKKEALGLGDVKFFAASGLFLSPLAIAPFMFIAGIIGTIWGLYYQLKGQGERFPFGPALAVAFLICITYTEWVTALFRHSSY